jgi:Xaa-Pro dipeptidase
MDRLSEIDIKYERVKKFLKENGYDGVLLSSVANFSWLTGGGDTHVENHNKFGVASLYVTDSKKYVITNNIEAERILNEQLEGVREEFEFAVSQWYDPSGEVDIINKLTAGKKTASDAYRDGMSLLGSDFSSLRFALTEAEVERFRWLGEHSSRAVEAAAREIRPGMTEHEIEAVMAQKLTAANILPVVLLVAGDERNMLYRHQVPTENIFKTFAKLVCCARKWGLIVSLTRSVHVGAALKDLNEKQDAVVFVDAVYLAETKPGVVVGKIMDAAKEAYAKVGYPSEWQHHHQGGPIGYEAREFIGISESTETVKNPQAFAWNPTIHGNKSEDSFITSGDAPELITVTGKWPMIETEYKGKTYQRPAILEI